MATTSQELARDQALRDSGTRAQPSWRSALASPTRVPLVVFALVAIGAVPLYRVYGDSQWFFFDEWDFLADRELTDVGDLLRPHNEHWTTIPVVIYRVLFHFFGLRSYAPYQTILIVAHVGVGILVRVLMRRSGVNAWIATAAASLFVLLGAANENIVWAFQIGFVGSLLLGLVHLLLADHDGSSFDRRDGLGLLAGAGSLMCSGVGVTMVAVVGLVMLLRRGWRLALVHVAPLAAMFAIWWALEARDSYESRAGGVGKVLDFAATAMTNVFEELGQTPVVALLLVGILAFGLVIAVRSRPWAEVRRDALVPGVMFLGGLGFLVVAGSGRAGLRGIDLARSGRYLHIVAALSLPVLAFAADAIVRRWRLLLPVVVALFVAGIPGNIAALRTRDEGQGRFWLGAPDLMLLLPRLDIARDVPRSTRPAPVFSEPVTIGWLLDTLEAGRLPRPESTSPMTIGSATIALAFEQSGQQLSTPTCSPVVDSEDRTVDKGDLFAIRGGSLRIVHVDTGGARDFEPGRGSTIRVLTGPLAVRFVSVDPNRRAEVCS